MADEIDFSEFLPKTPTPVAPLPSIAPAPVAASPGGDIDFSEFMPTAPPEPGLAPAPSRPGFNIAKWLGPAGPEPVGPVQTQVTVDAPITPGQASDYQATKLWRALELERQDMRANPEPRIGSDGGPAPATSNYLDKYPVSKALGGAPSATFSQLQNTLRLDQGLEQSLPVKGLGSQFATGLGTGLQKLGTGLNFNTASIDSIDQQDAAANQDFRTPQPGWDSAAGWRDMAGSASNSLGATAPMLAGAMATRGRTLPMLARPAAMAAEASGSNFAYNALTDPRMTPLQNLSESVIEGLMTRVGGKFEPGVGTAPLGQLPLKAVGEIGEEGATSGLQSVSGQVLDPNGDGSVDWRQAGVESTIGALAGGGASVGLSGPGAIVDQVKSDAKFIGDATPKPRPYTYRFPLGRVTAEDAASFDIAKGDSRRAIEAEEAKMTPEDLAAKRASEAEFDAMQQSDMEPEVPDAVEALANNAPAPNDGGTQDYLHFFGKPDNSQQETQNDLAPSRPDIVPEMSGKTTQMDVPVTQTVQARKDIVPEMSPKTQQLDVPIAAAPVKDTALSDAEAYINAMPAEDQAGARDALVDWDHKADPSGYKGNIEMLKGRKELAARKAKRLADAEAAKSKVVGYDAKGNIDTGVPVNPEPVAKNTVAPKAPVGPAPGPIQKPIDFTAKEGDVPHQTSESTDAPAVRKQLPRGAKKGPALVEQHLGKPGFPEKAPGNYVTRHVRLFADAGEHPMSVQAKGLGGYHIAWDPARRKAVMTAKTDTKGRKAAQGTELRPVDANGNVQTLDSGKVTLYSSVEAAVKAMAPLTKAAEPAVNVAVKGRDAIAAGVPDDTTDPENPANQTSQDTAPARKVATDAPEVGDEADQGPKKGAEVLAAEAELHGVEKELKALGARAAGLTDEELDRSDALEAKIKDLKATIATKTAEASASEKAKENSPLTPKMRMGLAKVLGADKVKDMTPREVGEVVRKTLHLANDKQPTQDEVGRAIRDLEADGVLAKGQAVIPGDGKVLGVNGGNLFSDPHEAKIVGIAQQALGITKARVLENAISDVPFSQSAQVETINGPKPTRLGHLTSTMVHHVARAINATGYDGAKFERWVARLHLQNVADWVARLHEPFRPVLQAVREQMDETKKERFEAYHRLDRLAGLKGKSRVRANMALAQFRLEDRQRADYGNPLTHTDSRGLVHTFTLTEKERKAVASVYRANRKLLRDQVNAILDILRLPRNLTHKDLVTGLANGSIKPSAQLVEDVLRVLETGSESYVPFMRTGPHIIRVYDQAAYNAAKNAQERKDAIRSTSNAGTLQQARKIISDATDKYPTAHITYQPADAMLAGEEMPGITEKAIIELAEEAGVAYGVMHQFLDGGISDYFATKGARARFKGASKLPGYDTDMYKVNVAHAMQMTNSTMALKYGKILENAVTKKAIPDNRLREYAKMFVNSMSAPASPLGGSVKSAITLWYLGFNAASAAINGTSAYIKGVLLPTLLGVNPAHLVTAPVEATKQMTRALAATLGRGHLGKLSGKNQVQLAIDGWKKTNPGLSDALRDADHAGHLQGKYDIDADDVAKYGEARFKGKAKRAVFDVAMHGFSSVERANRLASSVIGYQLWESMQKAGPIRKKAFDTMTRELNMDTSSAAKFMVSYSNFINFRNDKTESPAIARGNFDAKGQFHNSMLNQGIYALKNYAVNETVSAVSIARAAWKAGAIPRATFLALTAGAIMSFGALTTVVGGPAAATAYKELNGKLHTLEYTAKHSGPVARTLTTGGAGLIAEKIGGQQVGDYIDLVVKRSNNAEAIPSSLSPSNLIAGWGMLSSMGDAYNDVVSGNPERVPRGAARLAGKGPSKIVEWGQAWANGGDKLSNTGAPLVAGPAHALPGDPVLNTMDYVAGMAGLTPPIVSKVYEKADMEDTMKKSNDKELEYVVQGLVKSYEIKDPEARKASVSEFTDRIKDWNKAAVEIERYDMYITDEILETSLRLAFEARQKGAFNLKKTPVLGRGEMIKFLKDIPESNRQPEKAKE